MPLKIKPVAVAAEKWDANAARAADIYAAEAEAAAEDWVKGAAGGADNFHKAITAAGIKERFASGVKKAGSAKFARKIRDVAKDRFGPGIHAAVTDYATDVEPYFSTIAAMTLPPRAPRGDPANYARSEKVGKELNAKRLAMLGGGRS